MGARTALHQSLLDLSVHDHVCLIYSSLEEQIDVAIPFICFGLERGEKCIYIADDNSPETIEEAFHQSLPSKDDYLKSGALQIVTKNESYLKDGPFDAGGMLAFVASLVDEATGQGYAALRVTGEMTWALGPETRIEDLIQYESEVNYLLDCNDCLALCQYNRVRFSPKIIREAVETHPYVIYNGQLCENDFYIPPSEKMSSDPVDMQVERMLDSIGRRQRLEGELIKQNQLFRALLDTAPDAIFIAEPETGRLIDCNRAAEALIGRPRKDILNLHQSELHPADEREAYIQLFKTATEEAFNKLRRIEVVNANGERIPVEVNSGGSVVINDKRFTIGVFRDVREREAQQRQIRLQSLVLDQIGDLVTVTDLNGTITYVNQAVCKQLKARPEQLIGQPVSIYGDDPALGATQQEIIDKTRLEGSWRGEVVNDTSDGASVTLDCRTRLVVDKDGEPVAMAGISSDITERKRILAELQQREHQFRTIFDRSPVGIFIFSNEKRIVDFNDEFMRIVNTTPERLIDLDMTRLDDTRVVPAFDAALRGDQGFYEGPYHTTKSDKDLFIRLQTSPQFDRDGRQNGGIVFVEDLTHLRQSEMEYSAMLQTTRDGFLIVDLQGCIIDANQAMCEQLGYQKAELLQLKIHEIDANEVEDDFRRHSKVIAEAGHARFNSRYLRKDNTLIEVDISVTYLPHGSGRFVAFIRDITETVNIRRALEKRILALTQPMTEDATISFSDLFDIDEIQELQDKFAASLNVSSLIIDPDGRPLTETSNESDLNRLIRSASATGAERIHTSLVKLAERFSDGISYCQCPGNGLMCAATSISVGGKHIANWLVGQVKTDAVREDDLIEYALKYGIDEQDYQHAIEAVPAMSNDQFKRVAETMHEMAQQLSKSAFQNIQQARFIAHGRQAEKTIRETNERLELIQRSSALGVWDFDIKTGEIIWDDVMYSLYGVTRDSFTPNYENWTALLHDDDRDQAVESFETALKEHSEFHTVFRVRKPNADMRFIVADAVLTLDAQNQPERMVGVNYDITSLKRAEAQLRENEAKYRSYIDHSPIAVFISNADGDYVDVNQTACSMLGYSRSELLCLNFSDVDVTGDDAERLSVINRLKTEGRYQGERRLRRFDGSDVFVQLDAVVLDNGLLMAFCSDLTDKRALEEQLRQSQKMEAVGRLAGGVAHDFNNILMAILGYSEMLMQQIDDPGQKSELEQIYKAGQRASSLTNQLLAFSRRQIQQPRVFDVNAALLDLEKMLRRLLGEDIALTTQPSAQPLYVKADPGQFDQVAINIAVNAKDAMPRGGAFTISVRRRTLEHDCIIQMDRAPAGAYIELLFKDEGEGIAEENLLKIFEPFFTTKEAGRGTGLGLATVYGIVRQSHGFVDVKSETGAGTTFYVLLPECQAGERKPDAVKEPENDDEGQETILVVEDDPGVRVFIEKALTSRGYRVLSAPDLDHALKAVAELAEAPDALISDVVLPRSSGREIAHAFRERYPGIKVLFISGYTDDTMLLHDIDVKQANFLQKPFSVKDLVSSLRAIMQ